MQMKSCDLLQELLTMRRKNKKKHFFNQGLPYYTEYDRNLSGILETSIQKENT